MKKLLSERVKILEEAGIDTTQYNLKLDGLGLDITEENIVEDKQINNEKLFRRWITAQTFKMLESHTFNIKTRRHEYGWDAYLRNAYSFEYQFKMMLEELKTLNKLEVNDKDEFMIRSKFFDKQVVTSTCAHYINQLYKYTFRNQEKGFVKLHKYGKIKVEDVRSVVVEPLNEIITMISFAESYAELYFGLRMFMKKMNKLPFETPKCPDWKTAFKGSGAFYSLQNLILFHNVTLRYCEDKQSSIDKLHECLNSYKGDYWRFHQLLKDTIEFNNFDLRKSIKANK